jgi:hypothetical protein
LNLADDEIIRLSDHLSSLQADIAGYKDLINRLNLNSMQQAEVNSGREKRFHSEADADLAQIRTEHHTDMQELQQRQSQQLASLHRAFENAIAEIERTTTKKIAAKVDAIDEVIKRTKLQYERVQASIGSVDKDVGFSGLQDFESFDHRQQQRLREEIQSKSEQRLSSLIEAKSRLSECVNTLEELERHHTAQMATYKVRLDTMDERYREKVDRETDRQTRATEMLSRKLAELDRRGSELQKSIARVERSHKTQFETAVREGELLIGDLRSAAPPNSHAIKGSARIQTLKSTLVELGKRLELRENELMQARTDNDRLKREVARLQHEARIAIRRTGPDGRSYAP